jgi:hypothetical protein
MLCPSQSSSFDHTNIWWGHGNKKLRKGTRKKEGNKQKKWI